VALQLDILSKQRSVKDIRAAMKTLPKTPDEFYDRILLQIEEDDRERAHIALQWIAFAVRPISLKELAEAIIVIPNSDPAVDEEDRVLDCKTLLDFLPAGLVSTVATQFVSQNDKPSEAFIQFAHFSVKEYLVSARILEGPAQYFQVQEVPAHKLIAKTCFAYMLWIGSQEPDITYELFSNFPLLDYSAQRWAGQMCALDDHIDDDCLQSLVLSFMAVDTYAWRLWGCVSHLRYMLFLRSCEEILKEQITSPTIIDLSFASGGGMHPLTLASMFSMNSLLQLLLSHTSSIDEIPRTTFYVEALTEASEKGNLRTVQILVNACANHPDRDYLPALLGAANSGSCEKVKFLLDQGADVNATGPRGTALHATAMGYGEAKATETDPHTNGAQGYGTALAAVQARYKGVLELLLQSGADVNVNGGVHVTALIAATTNEFIDGVHLLLAAGARINDTNSQNQTALQVGAMRGFEEIVKILLQWGADPNPKDLSGNEYFEDLWGEEYALWPKGLFKFFLDTGVECGIEDLRAIHQGLIEEIRQIESQGFPNQSDYAKSFQELLETLPQWQAVKDRALPVFSDTTHGPPEATLASSTMEVHLQERVG